VTDDEKAIEHAEGDRRNTEEVHRGNRFPVITEKGKPALDWLRISRCPFHPTRDRSLRNIKTEHEKLAMNLSESCRFGLHGLKGLGFLRWDVSEPAALEYLLFFGRTKSTSKECAHRIPESWSLMSRTVRSC
jgi:hypothetical protein